MPAHPIGSIQLMSQTLINKDGTVSITDATTIQKYLASLIDETQIDLTAAIIVGNELSINDATLIQKYLAKIINEL